MKNCVICNNANAAEEGHRPGCPVVTPHCHGRFSTDWVDPEVPRGGAEEIAALRAMLDEKQQEWLKETVGLGRSLDALEVSWAERHAEEKDIANDPAAFAYAFCLNDLRKAREKP